VAWWRLLWLVSWPVRRLAPAVGGDEDEQPIHVPSARALAVDAHQIGLTVVGLEDVGVFVEHDRLADHVN